MAFANLGILLLIIAFIVPAWVGALALRKASPQSGAKVTFIGCVLATVGIVSAVLIGIVAIVGGSMGGAIQIMVPIVSLMIPLGMLVFMVGFALHGLQVGRVVARIGELEAITTAQQEQISRLEGQ